MTTTMVRYVGSFARRGVITTGLLAVFATSALADTATLVTATGSHPIEVEIADTPKSREIGLMNREELEEGTGMLFDFKQTRPVSMWMKNTLLPLDMLFLAADGEVVRIARNAKPMSLDVIPSGKPVRFVLEINGGEAASYSVKAGDKLKHPLTTHSR